jgi:hypothetical protein
MKIFFLNLLMNVALGTEAPASADYNWVIAEMDATSVVMTTEAENKVKVFDASGNLVKEFTKSENLNKAEREVMAQSELMYEYLGDAYYLLDK